MSHTGALTSAEINTSRGAVRRALDAAIIAGAVATVPVIVLLESHPDSAWINTLDWLIWAAFASELAFQFMSGLTRRRWREHVLPLTVVVLSFPLLPTFLSLVRLTRLIRLLRVMRLAGTAVRGARGLREVFARQGLLYVSALSCFLIVAGGGALALLEPNTAKGGFGDGVWSAVVTASTVGYGDIAPSTVLGRCIAVAMMLAGIGLVSTLAASITAYFVEHTENTDIAELKERAERIERLLEAALADRRARDQGDGAAVSRR